MTRVSTPNFGQANRVVIIGGGPGGYEAALVAAQLGAEVTVVDTDGLGGSAVAHRLRAQQDPDRHRRADDRPRRSARARGELRGPSRATRPHHVAVDLARVNQRVKELAADQSADIGRRLERERRAGRAAGCRTASTASRHAWSSTSPTAAPRSLDADAVLVATGAAPPHAADRRARTGSGSSPGSRSTTSTEAPPTAGRGRLRCHRRGVRQRLHRARRSTSCSSPRRDRVLPGEDADAADRPRGRAAPVAAWRCSRSRGWSRSSATATR